MRSGTPLERLRERVERLQAPLCLGIDPNPAAFPEGITRDVRGLESFARGLVEAAGEQAVAVKANIAFFEAFGSAGLAVLEGLRRDLPPDHVLIVDAKRGDLGSTAERYAAAIFERLGADGVTLSPYLGADAIEPFLRYPGRLVYVLARTSNPDAPALQDLRLSSGETLSEHVATWVDGRWPVPEVGLVVGATAPAELDSLRALVPGPAFLVPGVGAQGGDAAAAARACHGSRAPGVVNVSRGIAGAARTAAWRTEVAEAAERWRAMLAQAGATLGA